MRLTSGGASARCETFEARPYALRGKPEEVFGREWTLELLDPYGNRFTTRGEIQRQVPVPDRHPGRHPAAP